MFWRKNIVLKMKHAGKYEIARVNEPVVDEEESVESDF